MKIIFLLLPFLYGIPLFIKKDFIDYMRLDAKIYEKLLFILGFLLIEGGILFSILGLFVTVGFMGDIAGTMIINSSVFYMISGLTYSILLIFFTFGNKLRKVIQIGGSTLMILGLIINIILINI